MFREVLSWMFIEHRGYLVCVCVCECMLWVVLGSKFKQIYIYILYIKASQTLLAQRLAGVKSFRAPKCAAFPQVILIRVVVFSDKSESLTCIFVVLLYSI